MPFHKISTSCYKVLQYFTLLYVVQNHYKLRLSKPKSPKTVHNIAPVGLLEGLDPFLYHSSIYNNYYINPCDGKAKFLF